MLAVLDKRGTRYIPIGITFEIIWDKDIEFCPPVQGKKRAFSRHVKSVGTLVVLNRKRIGKGNLASRASSFGLDGELDRLTGKLRGKFGLLPDGVVHLLMQNLQGRNMVVSSIVVGKLRGSGELLHGLEQGIGISNLQFYRGLNVHGRIWANEFINMSAIPLTVEAMGFLAEGKRLKKEKKIKNTLVIVGHVCPRILLLRNTFMQRTSRISQAVPINSSPGIKGCFGA